MALRPARSTRARGARGDAAAARDIHDERPALEVLAGSLVERRAGGSLDAIKRLVARDRDAWLRRLQSAGRSDSAVSAYRIAIDDLLAWAQREGRGGDLFDDRGSWTTSMTTGGDAIRRRRPTTGILCCCATSCNGSAAAREPRTPIRCSAAGGWAPASERPDRPDPSDNEGRGALKARYGPHTPGHTAATWLRQETGDTRLVAEYLGHADLSTIQLRAWRLHI